VSLVTVLIDSLDYPDNVLDHPGQTIYLQFFVQCQPQFTVVVLFDYDVEVEDRNKGSTTPGIRFHEVFNMNLE
jgi:hypothetical protein